MQNQIQFEYTLNVMSYQIRTSDELTKAQVIGRQSNQCNTCRRFDDNNEDVNDVSERVIGENLNFEDRKSVV